MDYELEKISVRILFIITVTVAVTFLFGSIAISPVISQEDWTNQKVDNMGLVGQYSSLEVDSNGTPHIAYYNASDRSLKYAVFDRQQQNWTYTVVDNSGQVGQYASLELDNNNNPHIAYVDYSSYSLKYAVYNPTLDRWFTETVDDSGQVGIYNSLAIDKDNNPHISYFNDSSPHSLKYAFFDGKNWNIETVDSDGVGHYTSIDLDSNNNPHIAYQDMDTYDLKHAVSLRDSWILETVDTGGYVGYSTSIEIDRNDTSNIAYIERKQDKATLTKKPDNLRYASYNGNTWNIQTIDKNGSIGGDTSLELNENNIPHIAYFNTSNNTLKYAVFGGQKQSWGKNKIRNLRLTPMDRISLDLQNNTRHLSYYNRSLEYIVDENQLQFIVEIYDTNGEHGIQAGEVRQAIKCYLFGANTCINNIEISTDQIKQIIRAYIFK